MNLFPWTVFLPEGFENGIIQRFLTGDYMAWGSISLFAGFLEKENSLETLIVIFEKVSPKGFLWLNMKNLEISVLTANYRYLQTAALKPQGCHFYGFRKYIMWWRCIKIDFCISREYHTFRLIKTDFRSPVRKQTPERKLVSATSGVCLREEFQSLS